MRGKSCTRKGAVYCLDDKLIDFKYCDRKKNDEWFKLGETEKKNALSIIILLFGL